MAITPKPAGNISAPNDLSAKAEGELSPPNSLTSESVGTISTPNSLSASGAGSISTPNSLSAESQGVISTPNSLSDSGSGSISSPSVLGSSPAGSISVPNSLTPGSIGVISPPSSLTPLAPGVWPESGGGPTPPPREDFYYYFGASGSQTLRTNEIIVPDTANDDYEISFELGAFGFTGIDQTFVSQSIDQDYGIWIYADPDNMLCFRTLTNDFTSSVDINGNEKITVRFVGTTFEILRNDVTEQSGSYTRLSPASNTPTFKIGSRQVSGGYSNTLQAVIYNVNIKPLNGAPFDERLYLIDENSDATVEYYSQTQLSTWINYNAANWQGTP
jgi:hypothetical protein